MSKKVLMFGWEYPPHISGGLGPACYGITHALSELSAQVTFVVPKLHGASATRIELRDASKLQFHSIIKAGVSLLMYVAKRNLTPRLRTTNIRALKRVFIA